MKYTLFTVLVLLNAYTAVRLVEARKDLNHLELVHTQTIQSCAENLIGAPISEELLEKIKENKDM